MNQATHGPGEARSQGGFLRAGQYIEWKKLTTHRLGLGYSKEVLTQHLFSYPGPVHDLKISEELGKQQIQPSGQQKNLSRTGEGISEADGGGLG